MIRPTNDHLEEKSRDKYACTSNRASSDGTVPKKIAKCEYPPDALLQALLHYWANNVICVDHKDSIYVHYFGFRFKFHLQQMQVGVWRGTPGPLGVISICVARDPGRLGVISICAGRDPRLSRGHINLCVKGPRAVQESCKLVWQGPPGCLGVTGFFL